MRYRVGIDIGGTFTDGVVIDSEGRIQIFKDPSTPSDPSIGLINTLKKAARFYHEEFSQFLGHIDMLVHGTTVATNTMLQYKGVKTALIATKGFRDALEMRRAHKEDIWNLSLPLPPMIIPRALRFGVSERLNYKGEILTPLDEEEVRQVARCLKAQGVLAVAVCTLFSFTNDVHEKRIKQLVLEEFPEAFVSISSEILRQIREYERASTVAVNAYISPSLSRYLKNLQTVLKREGLPHDFLVTQSNGGVMSASFGAEHGVMALLSGPSAGAVGGKYFAEILGYPNLIVCDMGGTSFDVTLIKDGEYTMTMESEVARYRVGIPAIDIHTIGAGGGSLSHIDEGGMLRVGPLSAGAVPGPVCYKRGGTQPATTDANLVLGYLNPDYFLGGEFPLDVEGCWQTMEDRIGKPLGIDATQAAFGIYQVVNSGMADALRVVSVQRGHDPREFMLVAAGGAGPIHASRLAQEVGIPKVIVPRAASVFCALGMLESDLKHDYVRTYWTHFDQVDPDSLETTFCAMEEEGMATLAEEGVAEATVEVERYLDMRYIGQHHEVTVRLPKGRIVAGKMEEMATAFHATHERLYTYCEVDKPIETINIRVTIIGRVPKTPLAKEAPAQSPPLEAIKGSRQVFFAEYRGRVATPLYDAAKLQPGHSFSGPAIIEAVTTSIVVCPGDQALVDDYGNVILEVKVNG
ncbi:MAG: hydantoinase/oxoprolinase family protein [Coprothermobacterota bacterium]|nr:hydantoinase/oxoprolinase family protein [Coprothermobacterota bacterium]